MQMDVNISNKFPWTSPVTEVTRGLYPLIGGQVAITRDVGEGFPIHRRGRIFTCSSYAEEKRLARKQLTRDLPCVDSYIEHNDIKI